MFKTTWDKDNNIVLLVDSVDEDKEIIPPRIVFSKELEILGIDLYNFPQENVPVCWAIERKYFYKGEIIFEAKGGDIFHSPQIIYPKDIKFQILNPIDLNKLFKINNEKLNIIENESMDFINDIYLKYSKKVDAIAVAFSGGKDSQVVLDLVSRVIPPSKYKVYYTNTGMELPCTSDTIEYTKKKYRSLYKDFELIECYSEEDIVNQWKRYGPPSRMNRWCCKVRKTALFARVLKDSLKMIKQPKCIVFEGVRADESTRREQYNRIGEGVKHTNLINCRPIFYWNETEIYIYLVCIAKTKINQGYTYGLTRIGCNICPFASAWSEYLINKIYPNITEPFINIIKEMALNVGIKDKVKVDEYISLGNWKKNAGGKGLNLDNTRMDIISKDPNYECNLRSPKQDWKLWLNTVGEYTLNIIDKKHYKGTIKYEDDIIPFAVEEMDTNVNFIAQGTTGKLYLTSYINKALTKTAYCERCGVCEAECPTGALIIRKNKLIINPLRCIHCHKCYDVNSYGCIVASRRRISEGGISMGSSSTKTSGVDKYSTFGLKTEWFNSLMEMENEWFKEYPGLGPKMIPAAINWLRDAKIIDLREKKLSDFGVLMKKIYEKNQYIAWQLIWINICQNSPAINIYILDLINNCKYSKQDLITMLQYKYPNLAEVTLGNPASAIFNMFDNNIYLGCSESEVYNSDYSLKMGVICKNGKERLIKKLGTDNISNIAIAYLLYSIAEKNKRYSFTVSELYEDKVFGPKSVFNIKIEKFHTCLRALTEYGILSADLLGGLDNIHLHNELTSYDVLKEMLKKI